MKLMIVIALAFCMFSLADCDLATESDAYAVEVIIYRLTTDTWTANGMETTLAGAVSSAANTYCESNTATCGLTTCCTSVSISFKETDVGKVSGYPQKDLKNLKHKFYLKFPTGFTASNSSVTEFVVVNSAVYEILRIARTTFHTSTGYWITWADETYYGVPATTQENQIIIPIAFVVLFAVIFLAIGLHFWNKKKQNEIRLRKKIDDKKAMKKAMVQPTYRVDPDIKDIDDEQAEKTKKDATKKPRKEKMYNDNYPVKQSEETGKKHFGGASDTDSAIKMDPQHEQMDYVDSQAQNRNLPPLDVQEEGDKKKKKKKKEKKKKHHGDGYDNQSATLSTEL